MILIDLFFSPHVGFPNRLIVPSRKNARVNAGLKWPPDSCPQADRITARTVVPMFHIPVLCGLSNGPSFSNLPACRSTAGAGLRRFPHRLDMFVFSALCSTGFADICTNSAELMRKPRVGRKHTRANAAYRRALMTKPDRCRHL